MRNNCRLCEIIYQTNKIENTILNEEEHFIVVPTIGQFVEGWLLIISKSHQISSRYLTNKETYELENLIFVTTKIVESYYGPTIFFEHGPSIDNYINGGCSINHTHIHIVPFADRNSFDKNIAFDSIKINKLYEVRNHVSFKQGYFIWGYPSLEGHYNLSVLDSPIPRQYLRRVLAVSCKMQHFWDWRKYPFYSNIKKTINRLSVNAEPLSAASSL